MNKKTALAVLLLMTIAWTAVAAGDEDVLRPSGSPTERHISGAGARASRQMILGFEGGINYSMFSQTLTRTGFMLPDSPENVLESGTGISPYFGITADFPIVKSVGLQIRALYDAKKVGREISAAADGTNDFSFEIVNVPLTSKYTLDMTNLTTAFALRVDLTPSVFITAGPMAQFTVGDVKRNDEVRITKADSFYFRVDYDNVPGKYSSIGRETNKAVSMLSPNQYATDSGRVYSAARFGLEFGLGAKLDIGRNLWLVPQVRYQFMLSPLYDPFQAFDGSRMLTNQPSLIEFSNPKLHSLQFGLALWFGI
ncbi:MAG: outer membrane beta-barrel protein [Bacteroidetes bacterium]|nr:outer membrane beta-barrel protein [Bacteroidota bacterium]